MFLNLYDIVQTHDVYKLLAAVQAMMMIIIWALRYFYLLLFSNRPLIFSPSHANPPSSISFFLLYKPCTYDVVGYWPRSFEDERGREIDTLKKALSMMTVAVCVGGGGGVELASADCCCYSRRLQLT